MVHQDYKPGSTLYVLGHVEIDIALWFDTQSDEWRGRVGGDEELYGDTHEAVASAIERRIRDLVLALAPLLDDAGKRELVKVARIKFEHFPECTEERDFENEPEPFI